MIVSSYRIDQTRQLIPIAPEDVAEAYREQNATLWLDLQDVTDGELEPWLEQLEVDGLTKQLCLEARDRSAFYPLNREIFFVIPVLTNEKALHEVDYLACLCRKNLLLTVHRKAVFAMEDLDVSEEWLPEHSVAALVSAAMLEQSLKCLQHTADLRRAVLALEQQMDQEPDTVDVEDILDLRSQLVTLGEFVSDQLPCAQALSTIDKAYFELKDAREYMACARANLQSTDASQARLAQRIVALHGGFQMYGQEKTNRRLGLLTILSAIFMPLTLLAGIWGMNFKAMPELSHRLSYPSALGLMALVAVGMYLYFRRAGWFE